MTGIRKVIGMGRLNRDFGEKPSEMPYKLGNDNEPVEGKIRVTPYEVIKGEAKDKSGNIMSLVRRFGSGLEISIEREREINYHRDIGFRQYTLASPGMYNVSFSMSGYFSPRDFEGWGEALFINDAIVIDENTIVYSSKSRVKDDTGEAIGTYLESAPETGVGYLEPGGDGRGSRLEVPNVLLKKYFKDVEENGLEVKILYPELLNNPVKYALDICTVKYNRHTPKGGADEVGMLCGCIIDEGSFTYEVGSEMGLKFTLGGFALRDYKTLVDGTNEVPVYMDDIDEVDSDIYATGCLSIKHGKDSDFEEVAYTDKVSFTINNNIEKLPDCGQMVYSGGVMGALEISQDLQTYSDRPERYLPALYGVEFETEEVNGKTVYKSDKTYSIGKLPKPIDAMLVRSDDSSYTGSDEDKNYTKFFDIVTRQIYVGQLNHDFTSDGKILDEPTIQPFFGWVAFGKKV